MAATAQAQAEATKAAQRAGIEHAKANGERTYLERKPTYSRDQFAQVQQMLGQHRIAAVAKETGLTRQTDPAVAEAALSAWGL
jgi:DNA invertase Pin-like site-specific DNA recombinase